MTDEHFVDTTVQMIVTGPGSAPLVKMDVDEADVLVHLQAPHILNGHLTVTELFTGDIVEQDVTGLHYLLHECRQRSGIVS
jgi:hypothetical protein